MDYLYLQINIIEKVVITDIKQLLQLAIRTNNNSLKIELELPNLNTYLIYRLLKIKKNMNTFLMKNYNI